MDFWELPLGFAMGLAENKSAFDRYQALPPDMRKALILRARNAASEEEMKRIVDEI